MKKQHLSRKKIRNQVKPLIWDDPEVEPGTGDVPIANEIKGVLEQIHDKFAGVDDLRCHEMQIDQSTVLVVWIHSLVDATAIKKFLLALFQQDSTGKLLHKNIENFSNQICASFNEFSKKLLQGSTAIIMDGTAYLCQIGISSGRPISRPELEPGLLGPQDAFVESLDTNIGQIRNRIRSPRLKVRQFLIGSVSANEVTILFLDGTTKPEYVTEVVRKIEQIQMDAIIDINYIEEWMTDAPYSPFPTIQKTERPDRVAGALLEGRIAILTHGSPIAIILPVVFIDFLQSSEDYYEKYMFAFPIRILRHFYFWISLLLPAIYIALFNFHQEMVPTSLLKSIIASREGVPFPVFVEALIMEVTFEILREAGLRLPKTVGQSVSIVGALVIGEAAVQASIVSPVMVIIVAVTGIASFSIPSYSLGLTTRVLRFPIMVFAAFFGLYGVSMALLVILAHMATLKSLEKPYLAPIAPFNWSEMNDTFARSPWWVLKKGSHEKNPKMFNVPNME